MIRQKKGAETIVVWVLLIGFVIALTTTVFVFEKKKATELGKKAVIAGTTSLECNSVAINNAQCNAEGTTCRVPIINTGRRSVDGLIFRDKNGDIAEFGSNTGADAQFFPMKPGVELRPYIKQRNPNLDLSTPNPIEIVPLIDVSGTLGACNDKIINASIICNCY